MKNGNVRQIFGAVFLLVCSPLSAAKAAPNEVAEKKAVLESTWLSAESITQARKLCEDENVSDVLWVDGAVQASCAFAFGDAELREQNRLERVQRILRVRASGRSTDIIYQDAKLREPVVRALEGIRIERVQDAEVVNLACEKIVEISGRKPDENGPVEWGARLGVPQTETIAWAALERPFDELCAAGPYPMRMDDALGAEAHVIHLGHSGALTLYRGELLWVPYEGADVSPSLRMIWRSDFQVIYEQSGKKSSSSSSSKKKRKKKKRARR